MLGVIKKSLPTTQQSKWLASSHLLTVTSACFYRAVLPTITESVSKVFTASLTADDVMLKAALSDRRALGILGGTILAFTLISQAKRIINNRLADLYRYDFYTRMATEENHLKLTLHNDEGIGYKVYLDKIAETDKDFWFVYHKEIPTLILYLGSQFLYEHFASTAALSTAAPSKALEGVFSVNTNISIVIAALSLFAGFLPRMFGSSLESERAAEADWCAMKQSVSKSVLTHIGATSVAPKALDSTFTSYWKASSPLSLYRGTQHFTQTLLSTLENLQMPLGLIFSAMQGYDSLIMNAAESLFSGPGMVITLDTEATERYIKFNEALRSWKAYTYHLEEEGIALKFLGDIVKNTPHEIISTTNKPFNRKFIQFHYGEITCIQGKSGYGKTTLVEILAGFSNRVEDGGRGAAPELSGKGKIQYVPSTEYEIKLDISIFEFLTAQMDVKADKSLIIQRLKDFGLDDVLQDLDARMPQSLSNGQMKRLLIMKGMLQGAKVLILDETLVSISHNITGNEKISWRHKVMQLLKDYAKETDAAIIVISHEEDLTMADGKTPFASKFVQFEKQPGQECYIVQGR